MNHTLLTTDKAEIMGLLPLDNASRFKITITSGISYLWYYIDDGEPMIEKLGRGDWQLLGWSDEITEEQAKKIVWHTNSPTWMYQNYAKENHLTWTALESFTSLLSSKGITKRLYFIYKLK